MMYTERNSSMGTFSIDSCSQNINKPQECNVEWGRSSPRKERKNEHRVQNCVYLMRRKQVRWEQAGAKRGYWQFQFLEWLVGQRVHCYYCYVFIAITYYCYHLKVKGGTLTLSPLKQGPMRRVCHEPDYSKSSLCT